MQCVFACDCGLQTYHNTKCQSQPIGPVLQASPLTHTPHRHHYFHYHSGSPVKLGLAKSHVAKPNPPSSQSQTAQLVCLSCSVSVCRLTQDEDITLSLPQLLSTWRGVATLVAEVLALAAMSPFIIIELGSLQAYAGGWLSLWNLLDVFTYSLQVRQLDGSACCVAWRGVA